ncbi:MAG: hypothetical protein Q4E11_03315 [Corynebacterium sp.]|uniref:hypothetical protein n=1 Tax=Corynebacterium sp. TaxID=1720 RepID=UPI0026DCA1A3|nr:hypothetical protein [Corynebacterium sp.]MDO5029598.1 hypothetical protein [Corynebacterium sp.]
MSNLQPRSQNPIELRKNAVRKYSRNAVIWVGSGVVGGIVLGLLASDIWLFAILALIGAVGGFINWNKVQRIVNYKDPQ